MASNRNFFLMSGDLIWQLDFFLSEGLSIKSITQIFDDTEKFFNEWTNKELIKKRIKMRGAGRRKYKEYFALLNLRERDIIANKWE